MSVQEITLEQMATKDVKNAYRNAPWRRAS